MKASYPLLTLLFFLTLSSICGCATYGACVPYQQALVQGKTDSPFFGEKGVNVKISRHTSMMVDPRPILFFSIPGAQANNQERSVRPLLPWMQCRFEF